MEWFNSWNGISITPSYPHLSPNSINSAIFDNPLISHPYLSLGTKPTDIVSMPNEKVGNTYGPTIIGT